jgi:hypothetical protein
MQKGLLVAHVLKYIMIQELEMSMMKIGNLIDIIFLYYLTVLVG